MRLAYYDSKTAQHQSRNNGVHLQIAIDQTNTPEKEDLVRELKRAKRPRIAAKRTCRCRATRYEDCCYVNLPAYEMAEYGAASGLSPTQSGRKQ